MSRESLGVGVASRKTGVTQKIDRIESDPKDPRWAKIFLTKTPRSVARIPRESLTELRLREGAAWTAPLAKRVAQFVAIREARAYAMGLLAKATQNGTTISQRMERRGFDARTVLSTVRDLKADGWLNDDTHAALRAESLTRQRRGLSQESVAGLLEAEGVDAPRASRESKRVAGSAQANRAALAIARTAIAKRRKKSVFAVAAALARRGMDTEIITAALRSEGFDVEE
ncbi:MAG: hypothetical protein EXS01_07960, partial [Phycisphaerales bacterium]|nr:hypothetical protein [Phycisphaerales bacterium]